MSRFCIVTVTAGFAAVLNAIFPLILAEGATTSKINPTQVGVRALEGTDISSLTSEQISLTLKVLNDSGCDCGCGMTVAQCRVDDESCDRSPVLVRVILAAARRGEGEAGLRASYDLMIGGVRSRVEDDRSLLESSMRDSPVRGDLEAPVQIVVFCDFQDPFCRRAQPILKEILEEFSGKVNLAYRHFPLSIHPFAKDASLAAEAAREQGKFWEMHDLLFRADGLLDQETLSTAAHELGLDIPRFNTVMSGQSTMERLDRDIAIARQLDVERTPTVFIEGRPLAEYRLTTLREAVQRALDRLPVSLDN